MTDCAVAYWCYTDGHVVELDCTSTGLDWVGLGGTFMCRVQTCFEGDGGRGRRSRGEEIRVEERRMEERRVEEESGGEESGGE